MTTATLLIKEFVELGRGLGKAGESIKDTFQEYLSNEGFASLNAYHADNSIDDGIKQQNYVEWLRQLEEGAASFAPMLTADDDSAPIPAGNNDVDIADYGGVPKKEEVKLEPHVDDKPHEVDGKAIESEIATAIRDAIGNITIGGGGDPALSDRVENLTRNFGDAIEKLTMAKSAHEVRLEKHDKQLLEMDASGSNIAPSFSIKVVDAKIEWQTEAPLHYKFPLVATAVSNRIPTMIVGPAGWGKTSMVRELAKFCDEVWGGCVDYRIQSIGPQTSKSDILGYMDANGEYVESVFYQCFSQGMLYACDEADAGSAGSLTLLNQGFANQESNFPGHGMIERHENFVPMFLGNTYGQGANATYVGRNQLDAATLDRFAVVEYDYDEAWEGKIVGIEREGNTLKLDAGGTRTPEEWMDFVCRIRKATDSLAVRHVVSPRATINGIKLLKAGLGFTHVSNMCVWKGLDSATRTKVMNEADGSNDE